MKYKQIYIESMAYQDPEIFLSSDEFEQRLAPVYERLRLPQGRLELQTGIKTRGLFEKGVNPSTIAAKAAIKALEISSLNKDDIDLVVHASVCRDFLEPSTASVVHNILGLKPECKSFDLSNACLGFLSAMDMAASMIETGAIKHALIVTGENSGPLISETIQKLNSDLSLTRKSIKKYIANLTIGSAGVAFILSGDKRYEHKPSLLFSSSLSDTSSVELCQGDGNSDGLMMETLSVDLLEAGVKLAAKNFDNMLLQNDVNRDQFQHFVCHQVGVAHRDLLFKKLKLDISKDYSTFETYGNTGSAALPLTLVKAAENNQYKKDDQLALLGIGSGLHSIMMGLKW